MRSSIATPVGDLRRIRTLMERSRYFIGLSGLSGIGAGLFALLGVAAVVAYQTAAGRPITFIAETLILRGDHPWGIAPLPFLLLTGAVVLLGALACGYYFTHRRAQRLGHSIDDPRTYKLLFNLALPLAVGGVFCLALVYHAHGGLVGPATLVFYGMALVNGSAYASEELNYLGYMEIALGLVACFFIGYGLHFWAVGFGLLHIGYGWWMYRKYDTHE